MKKLLSNYLWAITDLDYYRRPNAYSNNYYRKVHVYFPLIGLKTWYGMNALRWQVLLRWLDGKEWLGGRFLVTGMKKGKVYKQFLLK